MYIQTETNSSMEQKERKKNAQKRSPTPSQEQAKKLKSAPTKSNVEKEFTELESLFQSLSTLKQLPRTGWLLRGVPQPESVAAHSFGVSFWVLWLATRYKEQESINLEKALSIAILHDLPEAQTGDLIPSQRSILFGSQKSSQDEAITKAESHFWKDSQSMQIPNAASNPNSNWYALWEEYRAGKSSEAKLVKQADALDCVLQAIQYRYFYGSPLEEFSKLIEKAAGKDKKLAGWLRKRWDKVSKYSDKTDTVNQS